MYVFTQKGSPTSEPTLTLELTADERTRSRYRYMISSEITDSGGAVVAPGTGESQPDTQEEIYLELPRGTVLHHGDCLRGDDHQQVLRIEAKPEPVLTVRATNSAQPVLLRAAYHLGNRHVALEVGTDYLRLTPDSVLESMLHQLGVTVIAETMPFQPESGAYGHHH